MKICCFIPIAIVGFTTCVSSASADLVREFKYRLLTGSPQESLEVAADHFDHFPSGSVLDCIPRVSGQTSGMFTFGGFSIVFNADRTATISWDPTNKEFLGVFVGEGKNVGNLYELVGSNNDRGSSTVHAPSTHSGSFPPISYIDFFCSHPEATPDGGTTVFMLATALGALCYFSLRTRQAS